METKITTVTISHNDGTYSASRLNIEMLEDVMQLIRGVLLSVGFTEENINEYIEAI